MSDEYNERIDTAEAEAPRMLDWKVLADQRLNRLVKVENDCSVMHERLERLRSEHDALLLVNDNYLKRLHALQKSAEQCHQAVIELDRRCASMEASRSWRITAPLRNFSTRTRRIRPVILDAVRRVIRRTRLGPAFSRIAPALHARARSRLYP